MIAGSQGSGREAFLPPLEELEKEFGRARNRQREI